MANFFVNQIRTTPDYVEALMNAYVNLNMVRVTSVDLNLIRTLRNIIIYYKSFMVEDAGTAMSRCTWSQLFSVTNKRHIILSLMSLYNNQNYNSHWP